MEQSRKKRLEITKQLERPSSAERRKTIEQQLIAFKQKVVQRQIPELKASPTKIVEEKPQELKISAEKEEKKQKIEEVQKDLSKEVNEDPHLPQKTVASLEPVFAPQIPSPMKAWAGLENISLSGLGEEPSLMQEITEPLKVEPLKVEPLKVEPPKVEPPKVEPPKVEPPKVNAQEESAIPDEQIRMPANLRSDSVSNNSSQAIFFTSRFQDFINQANVEPQASQSRLPPPSEHSASHPSLEVSNVSSLKYSFNEEASNERPKHPDSQAFTMMAAKLYLRHSFIEVILFAKSIRLRMTLEAIRKRRLFTELLVKVHFRKERRNKELTAEFFCRDQKAALSRKVLTAWHIFTAAKQAAIQQFLSNRETHEKRDILRAFKIILYGWRSDRQIHTYYLSKVFCALKNACSNETRRHNQKAVKMYISNLRRKYFRLLSDGVITSHKEKENVEVAIGHSNYVLLARIFTAWKEMRSGEEKYVSISLTTKNFYRETDDHRLLHTRTIDFKEMK